MSNMTLKLMTFATEWLVMYPLKKGHTGRLVDLKQKNISQEQVELTSLSDIKVGNINLTTRCLI